MTRPLVGAVLLLAILGGAGCGRPDTPAPAPIRAPATTTATGGTTEARPVAGGPPARSGGFVPGVTALATFPADLFTPQDAKERAQEYDAMAKRMIGDLEDEVRWQEQLETINASLSRKAPVSPAGGGK